MCSIFSILDIKSDVLALRKQALIQSRLQRHRGPDWSGIWDDDQAILVHERLSIVDVDHGAQPLRDASDRYILAVNGEIYNHRQLGIEFCSDYDFQTKSDCEVIIPLYIRMGTDFLDQLRGMFAFVLYDSQEKSYLITRDHLGIIPLYYGFDALGQMFVASELKALIEVCQTIQEFPPGHFYDSRTKAFTRYYERDWSGYSRVESEPLRTEVDRLGPLRTALETSVKSHLMSDVPYGALLSGGLDSSIIAAIAQSYSERRVEDDDQSRAWWPRLHTFAIGLSGSQDLAAALTVANAIGTVHHSIQYTVQEGIDALRDVIYHIETYDVTTIRASTPMYLMARKIKTMGIKMVLSGEGADEIFGGYLYFHKAPTPEAFHLETVRKLQRLHQFDCNRANKSMAAWGIEARVPFLDKDFLDVAMRLNPRDKMCTSGRIEKDILRQAFADLLPHEILWRQKEQFSDGVGYAWIDGLKSHAEQEVSDELMANAHHRFPFNTPATKEAYYYRRLFEELFPHPDAVKCVPGGKSAACSTPEALAWDASLATLPDPSGRAVRGVHSNSY